MQIPKTIVHRAQTIRNDLNRTIGRLTGNQRLVAKSRRDQAKVGIKQAGARIKDTFKH